MHTDTPSHGQSVDLILFGVAVLAGLALTPVRGLPRMLAHACRHEGDLAWLGIHR